MSILDQIFDSLMGSGSTIDLLVLAVKIVVLMFIISFVRERFGNSWFATLLTFVLAYIVLFQAWVIFGPIMIIYMFIIFGFTGLAMDLAIAKPWKGTASDAHSAKRAKQMRFI